MSDRGAEFRKTTDEDQEGMRHQSYDLLLDCTDVLRLSYDSEFFDISMERHGDNSVITFYRKHTI